MKEFQFIYVYERFPDLQFKNTVFSTSKKWAKRELYKIVGRDSKIKILETKTIQ